MSKLVKSNLAVAAGTALSRVTGLARVAVLGYVLGQGPLADAYNQANATPNIVYELLLGGVLSASLVPLFTRLAHDHDDEGTSAVVSVSAIVMLAITALAVLAAPLIFRMYALSPSTKVNAHVYRDVGTALSRIFLVQILFYGLNSLASAMLNARGRFFAAAWVPALSNAAIIASLWLVPRVMHGKVAVLTDVMTNGSLRWTLGLGATAGIALMALALIPSLAAAKAPLRFHPDFRHPAVQQLRKLSGWALGYVVANQVAIVVVQNLVHAGSGNQDAYTKAYVFFVLPHGLLAMSIATTFLPDMTRAVKERHRETFVDRTALGIRLVGLLTIPAGFGMFVLRRPIIGAVLQHGHFTGASALNTSRALAGFALGLGGFSVYLFVLRGFYAHHDARTPFVINVFENLVNIALAVPFAARWGVLGLGASFAVAYVLSAVWALQVMAYKVPGFPVREIAAALYRMVLASAVMAEAVWAVARLAGSNHGGGAVLRVVVGAVVGVIAYVGMLIGLGTHEFDAWWARLRRSPDHTAAQ